MTRNIISAILAVTIIMISCACSAEIEEDQLHSYFKNAFNKEVAAEFTDQYAALIGEWQLGELLIEPREASYEGDKEFPTHSIWTFERDFNILFDETSMEITKIEKLSSEEVADRYNMIYSQVQNLGDTFFDLSMGDRCEWGILLGNEVYVFIGGTYSGRGIYSLLQVN